MDCKIDTNGHIEYDKILGDKKALTNFYTTYIQVEDNWKFKNEIFQKLLETAPDKDKYKNYRIDWNIENIKPFFEEFNVRRFWFVNKNKQSNPYREISVQENELVAFQDGINTIFYTGEYLEGGQMYSDIKEEEKPEVDTDFFDESQNQINGFAEKKGNSNDFVYAYFPKRLFTSPGSKNFYILTQGKNLLRNREQAVIRIYFNLKPDSVNYQGSIADYLKCLEDFKSQVNHFIKSLKNYLNNRNIPFQTKLPTSLANFDRSDNFVLYVSQNHYYYIYQFIKIHIEKYKNILNKGGLPLFIKQFDANISGVGIAEDPIYPKADSFGSNRCKLIYNTIQSLSEKAVPFSVYDIIKDLSEQGYKDEFYRNPFTEYNYTFNQLNEVKLSDLYPTDTKFYLYEYGRVALNYALDLVERAIWLSPTKITWLTYYKSNDGKEEEYRLVNSDELVLIFWYLNQILKFPWMRKYFPENVTNIIFNENKQIDMDNNVWKRIDNLFSKDLKEEYEEIKKSVEKIELSSKVFLKTIEIYAKNVEEYLDTVLDVSQEDVIEKVYNMKKEEFGQNSDSIKNARKIYYKYIKPLYPIKNYYKNYEYVPTDRGKLQIAMVILATYCPSIFKKPELQQESSPKSLFQKAKSKLQVLPPI